MATSTAASVLGSGRYDVEIGAQRVGFTWPSKSGTPVIALENVDCTFPAGKVTAIIGPSGCGKSTLLQLVRGFLAPTSGRITLRGRGKETPRTPSMATVWQSFNLFPWLTVEENVAFGLEVAGMAKAERTSRVRAALATVDLAGFETKYPRQLSGGMRQRVGLARALVMEPDVLLLDEPFGALDAQTRLVLQEELARVVETTAKTAILVTHSIEEAILLGDQILVMTARPGRIAAVIPVELARPRGHQTTAGPEYAALFERIYGLLRDEVVKAMRIESGGAA